MCQGDGSEQDKAPTLMHPQCCGASHVNDCVERSGMSSEKDSDGVLWGMVGGRDEDQLVDQGELPGGGSTHQGVEGWGGILMCHQ